MSLRIRLDSATVAWRPLLRHRACEWAVRRRGLATVTRTPGQNMIEKIVQRYAVGLRPGQRVRAGDYVLIQPHHLLTHDNTGAVLSKFAAIGATKVANPRQPVFALDHDVQNTSKQNLDKYARIEAFARRHGIDFYPAGRGIGHQIMIEEGYALPGTLTVASDSHSNMYGGIGALGTPVVRTDAAAIWATGTTWWQVPPVVRVSLEGAPLRGVSGKDVIVALCGHFNRNQVLNAAIEFTGPGVATLPVEDRLAIANMTTEWGALAGVFPVDVATVAYLRWLARSRPGNPRLADSALERIAADPIAADTDALYAKHLTFDLSRLQPYVSGPNSVKVARPAGELAAQNIRVNKAYLVSCTNSRVSDLAAAADVVRAAGPGARVADGVELYVAPASAAVRRVSEERGDWQVLVNAGAHILPSGCGPCVGLGVGLLKDGEVGISASNRNFKGRMGSPNAQAYLASPAVVIASALKGKITLPDLPEYHSLSASPLFGTAEDRSSTSAAAVATTVMDSQQADTTAAQTVEGFPSTLQGELLFLSADNINTDGIYPGKYTYQDGLTQAQMAAVAMENYDPTFPSLVRSGDVLLAGSNFGTGSSREQAATALLASGVRLVLVASASETYKRNALNNGLLVVEAPDLVRDAKRVFGTNELSRRTGWTVEARLAEGVLVVRSEQGQETAYAVPQVGVAAQELVRDGGLEAWVKRRLQPTDGATQQAAPTLA